MSDNFSQNGHIWSFELLWLDVLNHDVSKLKNFSMFVSSFF